MLNVFAGPAAQKRILQDGFSPSLFDTWLGASGGPKWFVLAGIDRVLIPEFFQQSTQEIKLIGSSAGAFRAACLTQNDPVAAINRLAHHYSRTQYSPKPTPHEITQSARDILGLMLDQHGKDEIINNVRFKAHFVTARSKGLGQFENRFAQTLGMLSAAGSNAVSRRTLAHYFERVTFGTTALEFNDPYKLANLNIALSAANLEDALLASGSIPVIMQGIANIAGAPPGMYRDGGIIDYHFDTQFAHQQSQQGLTIYPHFYATPVSGWFDKSLKRRKVTRQAYDNVVMMVPTDEFVASLPNGKISDRKDFESLSAEQRIPYWQTILSESDRLGELFMQWTRTGEIVDKMQDFVF